MSTSERLGIILQARMGSTRLPGKILMPIGDMPLLLVIARRLQELKTRATFVIATSIEPSDDAVEAFCTKNGILCYRGSEENVLDRYYRCAIAYGFSEIVRMTGDNPFPDITALDRLISFHRQRNLDYSECFSVLPIGIGMELFSFEALEKSYYESSLPHHFEHVDEYILEHPALFHCGTLPAQAETYFPLLRATVDTLEDYQRANWIAEALGGALSVTTPELVTLLLKECDQ